MARASRTTRALLAVLGALLLAAAGAAGAPPGGAVAKTDYRGVGVVLALLPPPSSLHATRPVVVIEHQPIAGLMNEAMSMPFIAASTELFRGLRPGDHVAFGLRDTPDALLVVTLEHLPPGK